MLATLVADVTDTPVWFLFGATVGLALVTLLLFLAAWRALGDLEVGIKQLAVTVQQLQEAKIDRHIQVWMDFGKRWDDPALTEAQVLAPNFSRVELARTVDTAYRGRSRWNPIKNRRTQRANVYLNVLLRIPNFCEDLGAVVRKGTLDLEMVSKSYKAVATVDWDYWAQALARIRQEDPYAYLEWFHRGGRPWVSQHSWRLVVSSPGGSVPPSRITERGRTPAHRTATRTV
jgi:hypothetical protein